MSGAPAARAALALLLALPAGCSLSPHYQRPTVPAPPDSYKEAGDWQPARPADTTPRGHWWSMFEDPDLDALEAQVSDANQSLKAAFATLAQARAQTRIARSAWFPTITAQGDATRGETSVYQSSYTPGKDRNGNSFVVGGDLSYEVDLFGRIRNTVAGARASEQATAGDVATLDLELHAELATDYFTLRGLDIEQQLLDRTVADYAAGAAADGDISTTAAPRPFPTCSRPRRNSRPPAPRRRTPACAAPRTSTPSPCSSAARRAPSASRPAAASRFTAVPAVAIGLPSQLLERRPDVAAAERRVAAANAGIGVARAAYFPVLDLLGSAGTASVATSQLFTAPAQYWSIGPQALLTVFDGGLHAAQSAQAHALYDQQVANYRGMVLTAFQDVEDNLVALRQLQRESVSEAAAVTATQGALDQANLRYKGGIVTYLEVVSTENAALAARLAAADIEIRRAAATVLLVKALGGDWNPPRQGS